jgi:hypothetical protein
MKKALTIAALLLAAVTGTASAADKYDLKIDSKAAKASTKSVASLKITPKGEFHVNVDYPVKLKLVAPAGVTLEKETQVAKDATTFTKDAAEFKVAFTADSPGKKSFTGELKFAVCTEKDCHPQVEKVAFEVDVKK